MLIQDFTGRPVIIAGEYPDRQAAFLDASCNSGCPVTDFAQMTLPFSSTTTSTWTAPETFASLASEGYDGLGWLIAFSPSRCRGLISASVAGLGLLGISHSAMILFRSVSLTESISSVPLFLPN